jgi:hypothetical protein
MAGWKMVAARRAVTRMVESLGERDRFAVYAFDDRIETPPGCDGTALVAAGDRQRYRAAEFLARVEARGGTEMAKPLEVAVDELTRDRQAGGREPVLVLITDGQVGNEDQVLRRLGARGREVRIFTLGIDRAVNAAFLRRLADLGGGSSELVETEGRLDEVMDSVHRHIGSPVLTGLALEAAGLAYLPETLVPGRPPDLFAGAPLLLSGRYRGSPSGSIRVRARDGAGEPWSTEVRAWCDLDAPLAPVWARGRVRELEDRYAAGAGDWNQLEKEIIATSLRHGVLCRFTALVAVDRAAVANPGGQVHSVVQPVEQPDGWASLAQPMPMAAAAPVRCRLGGGGERKPRPRREKDLLQRLLDLFRRGDEEPAEYDRAAFRDRGRDLLRRLQAVTATDALTRLGILRGLIDDLETFFKDLVSAGEREPARGAPGPGGAASAATAGRGGAPRGGRPGRVGRGRAGRGRLADPRRPACRAPRPAARGPARGVLEVDLIPSPKKAKPRAEDSQVFRPRLSALAPPLVRAAPAPRPQATSAAHRCRAGTPTH